MTTLRATKINPPQAFISSYAPRIRTYGNSLLTPVIPPAPQLPQIRTTKRGTTAINYAEDGFDDDDFYDSEAPGRRPTGLRSLRKDDFPVDRAGRDSHLGKELATPVDIQGIWREWMGKPKKFITEKQYHVQCTLPLTLIPIRIDLDIPSFRPEAPLPTPANAHDFGIDVSLPAYRHPEPTPAFRLKDAFLWNLHEALMTPDQFARQVVDELDFPNERKGALVMDITNQIRKQLEDYAGVALHPLFHSASTHDAVNGRSTSAAAGPAQSQGYSPLPHPLNGVTSGSLVAVDQNESSTVAVSAEAVTAAAEQISSNPSEDIYNPDDTYRCIVNLNVNLLNRLYSDKFEWSLLHPPGMAEQFAKQTCADLGLSGEWVSAMSHAIYEAILRLKKDVCENGGLLLSYGEIDNEAAHGAEAGWRYDPEHLGDQWEPKVEILSKEEIEKREGERERQLRRARRETAKYSTTTNMGVSAAAPAEYFAVQEMEEQRMGRGERSKKKKRFRSLSPLGRDTPDASLAGYGGGEALREDERQYWRCSHCQVAGSAVWAVRAGPKGPKTLCHNCGLLFERDKKLPAWSKDLHSTHVQYLSRTSG